MKKNIRNSLLFIIFPVLIAAAGCSNMLTTVYMDPEDLRNEEPSPASALTATVYSPVDFGADSSLSEISLELIWSREVSGFDVADMVPANAAVSSFSGEGDKYVFTLKALSEGLVGFSISSGALDGADLKEDIVYQYNFNPAALTLSISSDETVITNQTSIPVYFDFSHDVEGFDSPDISVLGGTLSGFSGSGSSWSGNLTFTSDGFATVSVNTGAANHPDYEDILSGSASFSIEYDGTDPEGALSTSIGEGDSTGHGSLAFSLDISEETEAIDSSVILVTNGTISHFSGSGDSYTFDVTPLAAGTVKVELPAGVLVDKSGNESSQADSFSYVYDSTLIGVNITGSVGSVSNSPAVAASVVFSEPVTGLEAADFTVTNGTVTGLTGSGDTYEVTLTAGSDGVVSLALPSGAAVNGIGAPNAASSWTYQYDGTEPAAVFFDLSKIGTGTGIGSGAYSDEYIFLDLNSDYSGDAGSGLSYEYTVDLGSTWKTFNLIGVMLTENRTYAGINIRVSDEAGNMTEGSALTNITIDTVAPDAPVVIIGTDPVNASNYSSFAFNLSGGEAGINYYYSIRSSEGPGEITGSGVFDGSGVSSVVEDLSALPDGTITVRATAEDHAGNMSSGGTDGAPMDTEIPAAPVVSITSGDTITGADPTIGFEITGGEAGNEYEYVITSSAGGSIFREVKTFDVSGGKSFSGIDLSAFRDGVLSVSVVQTDDAGNAGPAGSDSVVLDLKAFNDPDFDFAINSTNVTDGSVTLVGEPGSSYSYTIYSTGGGDVLSGTGTFDGTGQKTIDGLDFSGMADGYLILIVDIIDLSGNSSMAVSFTEIDASAPPLTTAADFSAETGSVNFDMSYHGSQTVPSGIVKFDTDVLTGSDYDDEIRFSDLEDGEFFTVAGGAGFNTIDLSEYSSADVTVQAGQTGEDDGNIVITLPSGGTATILYSDFQRLEFCSNNFTGSPHAIELDTADGTLWTFSDTQFELHTTVGNYKAGIIYFEGSLGLNYQLDTVFDPQTDMNNRNGLIIFDYQDTDNYKYIRAYAKADRWTIGEVVDGAEATLATLNESIDDVAANPLQLRVTGAEGKTAELWSGGIMKVSYTFADVLNDGYFGLTNDVAHTVFSIDMTPSNWAPYARKFEEKFSRSTSMTEVTVDIIGGAVDYEGDYLEISELGDTSNGTLTDNGDGTVTFIPNASFYGVETISYTITDGTNETVSEIRIDVLP
ncbi:Ig-like domain-containing protein [Spirochaeta isovalerica]|uniref:Bacterial Ig-like domain-containing protein n=1 Tax=Spirochaeta isovalerica TaxID=150 RepID=A0A841R9R2_9SPIO|nr:hypothetical protein [Spirochaeta isovalerica]